MDMNDKLQFHSCISKDLNAARLFVSSYHTNCAITVLLRRMLYNRQGVVLKFGLAREISNSYAQRTGYSRNPQNKPPKQGK